MALILPKINSNTLVSDLSWMQEGYEYGINDTGPFQRFRRRGRNRNIEYWAYVLVNAGWMVTVRREKVADGSAGPMVIDTGFDWTKADCGISSLEASCGWPFPYLYGTETPENIWELEAQTVEKALLEADFPAGQLQPLSASFSVIPTSKAIVDMVASAATYNWLDAIKRVSSPDIGATMYYFDGGVNTPDGNGILQSPIHLPVADYATAKSLFYMLKKGVTSFPVEASVIRHSMVTSNLYAVQASYNNMDRLISSASMYSIEGVPGTLLFAVPTKPSPTQFIETSGDLQYGWYKWRPNITRLNRMKWRTQQNYQFGLWVVKLFGNVL